jgi:hypothetical protein
MLRTLRPDSQNTARRASNGSGVDRSRVELRRSGSITRCEHATNEARAVQEEVSLKTGGIHFRSSSLTVILLGTLISPVFRS